MLFDVFEQIDTHNYTIKDLRELAKDPDVYYMYNSQPWEKSIFENSNRPEMIPKVRECWRIRPLSNRVNDDKDDIEVGKFLLCLSGTSAVLVFRMKIRK